jgi:chemotaxis response regulator CheB
MKMEKGTRSDQYTAKEGRKHAKKENRGRPKRPNHFQTQEGRQAHKKAKGCPGPGNKGRLSPRGFGASAGGLDAFERFFTNMPPDTGMAFVLVQHLDPTHKSILSELIKRYTSMKVLEVEDGMLVTPNSVFVIPPNRYMGILQGKLHLLEPTALPGHRTPMITSSALWRRIRKKTPSALYFLAPGPKVPSVCGRSRAQ